MPSGDPHVELGANSPGKVPHVGFVSKAMNSCRIFVQIHRKTCIMWVLFATPRICQTEMKFISKKYFVNYLEHKIGVLSVYEFVVSSGASEMFAIFQFHYAQIEFFETGF